jgi:nucleoside-diphosphate-sugar epimerase
MRIAVTGANGYVGSRIAAYLERKAEVVGLTRTNGFVLGTRTDPEMFRNVDVLVHCAHDFADHERNVKDTLGLFAAARLAGVRKIIFISSMSAFDGCKSRYGKAKREIERKAKGIAIIRPGLVYDRNAGSIMGSLRKAAQRPIVPLVCGSKRLYLVHSEDLAALVWELCNAPLPKKPVIAAHSSPHTFREILQTLAQHNPRFVPVPYWAAYAGLRAAELLHIPSGLRSDSLVGLANADEDVRFDQNIKTRFRPFKA